MDTASESWKDLRYFIGVLPPRQSSPHMEVHGLVIGIRITDDQSFFAKMTLPVNNYPEGYDWTACVKKRLDTYLECACSAEGPCKFHQAINSTWESEDNLLATPIDPERPKS
jgi:hypothetical protein